MEPGLNETSAFYTKQFKRIRNPNAPVNHCHERADHRLRRGVGYHVAAVYDAFRALRHQMVGASEDLVVRRLASTANEDRDAAGDLDDAVVFVNVIARIRLDHVRSKFDGLPNEGQNLAQVSVNHVASRLVVRLHDERLNHEWHAVLLAAGL